MKNYRWLAIFAAAPSAYGWTPSADVPNTQLAAFVNPDGFEVTAWATTPMLHNPTNMDIDHLGRVWVNEGINYRSRSNRQPQGDKIVILEDTDQDGKADKSSTFWQDPELVAPLGIAVFDNVVIVSQPPNLLKLTDVNRDSKFNQADGDTREVLLTGFNGRNHDHSLHSVTGGPDGKWYFNQGNTCGIFTDKSGRTFPIGGSYYKSGGGEWPFDTASIAGKTSGDGFVYVGGFTVRMNPDATGAEIIGHGYRNSYEQTITSRGDVFQNDNDDPPACRVTHVLEHGNAGFFSRDGKRMWNADKRPGQDTPTAEWRQDDPGTMPSGDVYGGGSPTGIAFYENGALGEKFNGTLLSCEPGRNVIFSYQPTAKGASYALERKDFLTTNKDKIFDGSDFVGGVKLQKDKPKEDVSHFLFRPSDITVGPDGALYVTDWTDPRVGGHDTQDEAASGIIYRIAPKGFKPSIPAINLQTQEGAVAALRSSAVNTRWLGFQKLKSGGAASYEAVARVLTDPNPYVASRAIWLLPYLGEKGISKLNELISHQNESTRLTAFRAIRRSGGAVDDLPYARKLASDPSPVVRSEAALAMRYRTFDEAADVLVKVAMSYDGTDRAYLDNLGRGAGHHANALWEKLRDGLKAADPATWTDAFARLTWRLMPESAVALLKSRAESASLSPEQRKFATESLPFIDARPAAEALMEIAAKESPVRDTARWWLMNRSEGEWASMKLRPEMEKRGLIEKPVELVEIIVPLKAETTKFAVADVMKLTGDAGRGKIAASRCVICHKIDGNGPDYGPDLKGFGARQPADVIGKAIVEPSADISHGFEGSAINLKDGKWIDGRIIADGDPVIITSTGGITQKVPAKLIASRKNMDRSVMLSADQLGLSAQDVADILSWMKTY